MAARTHDEPVAVFDRFRHRSERRAAFGKRRERARHRHRHRRDDGFHHLVKEHREAAHFAVAKLGAHGKLLQSLHAADEEIIVAQRAGFDFARGGLFLLLLEERRQLEIGIFDAERFDLHFAMCRRPARAVRGVARLRHHFDRQADAHAGGRIDHHGPAEFVLVHLGGSQQVGALGRREDAGDLGLRAFLVILDGGQKWIIATERAGIVAGPRQRRLDFLTIACGNPHNGVLGGLSLGWLRIKRRGFRGDGRRCSNAWCRRRCCRGLGSNLDGGLFRDDVDRF